MSSDSKKGSGFIWLLVIALVAFLLLVLLGYLSSYESITLVLALLICLTLLTIWTSISAGKNKKRSSSPPQEDSDVYDNLPPGSPSLYSQSLQEYQREEADLRGEIEKSNFASPPSLKKAQEINLPPVEKETADDKYKIAEEVEEVLNRYRTSDIYKNYSNRTGGGVPASESSIILKPHKKQEVKERSEISETRKTASHKKPEVKSQHKEKKEGKETKKHKWVNVSEDKKGKVKFKEEEVEYTSTDSEEDLEKKEYDPDREAEEYILNLNKKMHELVEGEEEQSEAPKEDDEESFF